MATDLAAGTMFDSGAPLLYNVDPWNGLGFGVPNFGSNPTTLCEPIARFVDEIGKAQLFLMTGVDARRGAYPSVNTVQRLAKLINRAQTLLAGRQKQPNDQRLEAGHAQQNSRVFRVHPVPYFDGPMLVNAWLKEYNALVMIALTNMMRHGDNNLSLTITSDFASDIWPYFREVKIQVCTELLGMSVADASDDSKQMPAGPYAGPGVLAGTNPAGGAGAPTAGTPTYNPPAAIINMQTMQSPGPTQSLPGPADLRPLFEGIPANLIVPNLAQYPIGPIVGQTGLQGAALPAADALTGLNAVAGPGGSMGSPLGVTPAAKAVLDAVNANIAAAGGQSTAQAAGSGQATGVIAPQNA